MRRVKLYVLFGCVGIFYVAVTTIALILGLAILGKRFVFHCVRQFHTGHESSIRK